ncbi:MAG: purine-nucleoside phosphorylase [Gammaproteobacteria bacterium RIFCSPHIGHO2_12_FULL_41_20]|nr:MAG: purine-nucleoside phosphorylase [Gammaproteobacteria bacterium RIFCSPHIGHO2_12_FULL_41_20]
MAPTVTSTMQVIRRYAADFHPKVAILLGSGMGSIADQLANPITIPYSALGLPASGVAGHASLMMLGNLHGVPVVCLKGRLHVYEGVGYEPIRLWIRTLKQLGCAQLILTGAVGSLRTEVGPGELVAITDHINFHPGNPLMGPNDETVGPRFVSLENAYDDGLRDILVATAARLNIPLYQGVYIATLGPSFETPAEIRAFRSWGADVVGMSVVPEVIIARHCGLQVACITGVTNLAVGLSKEKVTHEGTLQFGEIAARKLVKLIPEFIKDTVNVLG